MRRKPVCPKCGQCDFSSLDNLQTHIVKQHFNYVDAFYKCLYPKCYFRFPTELARLKHELDVHLSGDLALQTLTQIQLNNHHRMGDAVIVNRLKLFFEKNGISTKNVAIATIQKSRSTEFSTLVANFDESEVIPNYPSPIDYREISLPKDVPMDQCKWLIAYKEALPVPQFNRDEPEKVFNKPFCCSDIVPYKPQNVSMEAVIGTFTNKKHGYKNYLCATHNLFYAVDVYDRANNVGRNFHHMRLNPFTKINTELMEEFFCFVDV
ncbi:hypothetical protein Ddc_13771 [Ditylenchus destructor]|nr:hypothetical protein Ddc_13771 [Ditylenchus destructor]